MGQEADTHRRRWRASYFKFGLAACGQLGRHSPNINSTSTSVCTEILPLQRNDATGPNGAPYVTHKVTKGEGSRRRGVDLTSEDAIAVLGRGWLVFKPLFARLNVGGVKTRCNRAQSQSTFLKLCVTDRGLSLNGSLRETCFWLAWLRMGFYELERWKRSNLLEKTVTGSVRAVWPSSSRASPQGGAKTSLIWHWKNVRWCLDIGVLKSSITLEMNATVINLFKTRKNSWITSLYYYKMALHLKCCLLYVFLGVMEKMASTYFRTKMLSN